jgi:uncharacterized membrane protein YidH (DUF202 family)
MTGPSAAGPDGARDSGLQPERTALAWRRTLLALVAADLLVWRDWFQAAIHAADAGPGRIFGLGAAAAAAAAATVVFCGCAIYRTRVLKSSRDAAPAALVLTAALGVVVLACAVVLAVVLF